MVFPDKIPAFIQVKIRTYTREERLATGKGWCPGGKSGLIRPQRRSQWITPAEYKFIQHLENLLTKPKLEVVGDDDDEPLWSFERHMPDDHATVRQSTLQMFRWIGEINDDTFLLEFASLQEARDLYLCDAILDWRHVARTFSGLDLAISKEQRSGLTYDKEKHRYMQALSLSIAADYEYIDVLFSRVSNKDYVYYPRAPPNLIGVTTVSRHTWTDESLEAVFTASDHDPTNSFGMKVGILSDLDLHRKFGPVNSRPDPWKIKNK
eukprot:gene1015-567_t